MIEPAAWHDACSVPGMTGNKRRNPWWLAVWIAAGVVVACSGSSPSDSPGDGGNAESGATGCNDYADEDPVSVTVKYENHRSTPIFVKGAADWEPNLHFVISDDTGGSPLRLFSSYCGYATCEILGVGYAGCDAGIAFVPIVRIDPGGSWEEIWNGLHAVERSMPESCYLDGSSTSTCDQMQVPAAATYSVMSAAGSECPGCTCVPSAEGSCLDPVYISAPEAGIFVSGESLTATTTVTFPAASAITLQFD